MCHGEKGIIKNEVSNKSWDPERCTAASKQHLKRAAAASYAFAWGSKIKSNCKQEDKGIDKGKSMMLGKDSSEPTCKS